MKKVIAVVSAIFTGILSAGQVMAQNVGVKNHAPLDNVAAKAGLQGQGNIGSITGNIIGAALSLVGIIFLILMVYAGILWMTAQGKDDQIDRAKKIIIAAIIGLFITVSAYAITVFVTANFT